MSSPGGPPIDPSLDLSVGWNHRQYQGSSGPPQAVPYQFGRPLAGSSQSTQFTFPQMHDAPGVEQVLPVDAQLLGLHLGNEDVNRDDEAFGSYQDYAEHEQHHCLPRTIRGMSHPESDDFSQYYPGDEEIEDPVRSDEEPVLSESSEGRSQARKRRGRPEYESKLAKRKAAVPGGAGANGGRKGEVKRDNFGNLQYFDERDGKWIPAVYHYQIREDLINKAQTSIADVYSHPRARGKHPLDITSYLSTQRDWDLERDNGWVGLEVLYMFEETDRRTPTYKVNWMCHHGRVVLDLDHHPVKDYKDIPLTLSSKVEGALMEVIRRIDPRIIIMDFWARLPNKCGKGGILTPNSLSERMTRFRLENCVTSLTMRGSSPKIQTYIKNRMTPAALAANSTRELRKLSKKEQHEARLENSGRFKANAAGWARSEKVGKPLQFIVERGYDGDEQRQPPASASGKGRQTRPNKRRKVHEPSASAASTSQISFPETPYGGAHLDPSLDPNLANSNYGPSSSSSSMYGILPTEVALAPPGQSIQLLPIHDSRDLPAGFEGVGIPMRAPAGAFPSHQYPAPAAQNLGTHWIPIAQGTLETPFYGLDHQARPLDEVEDDFLRTSQRIVDTFPDALTRHHDIGKR